MAQSKHRIIVYHENCVDGVASAWVLQKKWAEEEGVTISYVPYAHNDAEQSDKNILALMQPHSEVYFADVAPTKEFLDDLLLPNDQGQAKAAAIHVLDHHKTAATTLANYKPPVTPGFTPPPTKIEVDQNAPSACTMIWKKVFPNQPLPDFLSVIDKMDRGDGLVKTEDFSAAALVDSKDISSIKEAFNSCSVLSRLSYNEMAAEGSSILADQLVRIGRLDESLMHASLQIAPGTPPVSVPIINADIREFGRSIKDYLDDLAKKSEAKIVLIWYVAKNGSVTMSIRSNGTPDSSLVAEHFCETMDIVGGGHKNSAAVHFESLEDFCKHVKLQPADTTPAPQKITPVTPPAAVLANLKPKIHTPKIM